jgi:two-component system nitrogen regulation response regulator NtrX
MRKLKQTIQAVAPGDHTVLIQGPSGTGKEMVARAIHDQSRRNQEREVQPVGGRHALPIDIRLVTATKSDLKERVAAGSFREDLFYRLNVIPFFVPPLRDRVEDVPLLAGHFLREFAGSYGRKHKELTEEALATLRAYSWPGNVRELRNLMERIVIMNPQVRIDARHIPLPAPRRPAERGPDRPASLHEVRQSAERDYILKKLDDSGGNVSRAAEVLGLERSNLYKKMRALGIGPRE